MIRSLDQLHKMGIRKILDRLYFEMVVLSIMYKEYEFSDKAAQYARTTIMNSGFRTHRINGTGLYNYFVYFTNIGDFDIAKKDEILLKRTSLDIPMYVRILRKMATGGLPLAEIDQFIRYITKQLYIEDNVLRSFGRLSVNWVRLSIREKKVLIDKMERYGTIKSRLSLITSYVRELSDSVKVRDEDNRLKQRHHKTSRSNDTLGVNSDNNDTAYDDYADKAEPAKKYTKGSVAKATGAGILGGYILSKFLSSNPRDNKPMDWARRAGTQKLSKK